MAPRPDDSDRLAALRRLAILDTAPERAFDEIVQLAARACGAPVALVSLVDRHRQWFKARCGLATPETPIEVSFCAHALSQSELFVVPDATADDRFCDSPLVTGPEHIRFYAGAPFEDGNGIPLGVLCVMDRVPRPGGLAPAQADLLVALAGSVTRELKLRDAQRQLADRAAALAHAEQRYRALIEASGTTVVRVAPDGHTLERFRPSHMAGVSTDQLGRNWLDYLHPEDRADAVASWERAIRSPNPFERVERKLAPDGTYRWTCVRMAPLLDGDGHVTEWVGTITDIHEHKLAVDGLRESEERYRALVHASASICWRKAPDGSITDLVGWGESAGEDLGTLLSGQWIELVHPEDRERVLDRWRDAQRSGRPYSNEYRILFKGAYRWVLTNAVCLRDKNGEIREWVGTLADVNERVAAKKAAQFAEERYRLVGCATADAIWDWDLASDALTWGNPDSVFGYTESEIVPLNTWWIANIHPDDRQRVSDSIHGFIVSGDGRWSDEYRFRRADGTYADVLDRGFLVRDEAGNPVRMVGAMQDISYRKLVEETLRSSQDHLRKVLQALPAAVYTTDDEGRITYYNDAAVELWGREPVLGETKWSGAWKLYRADGQEVPLDRSQLATALREGRPIRGIEGIAERPDGSRLPIIPFPTPLYDAAGRLTGAINMLVDVTEQKAAEQKIWAAANQDPLTGLPNRALFHRRLEEALSRARQDDSSVGLLLIDLDEFKDVNDTLGHDAGDALLREIAARLKGVMRDCDTVARIGGDEFAVIATAPFTVAHAGRLAQELVERLREPFVHGDCSLSSKASIGVACYPDHHNEPHELMKDADMALYRAKALGRNQAVVYAPELRQCTEFRVSVVREMQRGLASDEIVPFYQPKICLHTGRIIGLEALARWQHPTKGLLTPGYFGSAFEDAQIASGIGRNIVRRVAADMRDWLARGIEFGNVAVNLSSAEFLDRMLADRLLQTLSDAGVPNSRFEVEVTETVLLGKSSDHATAMLEHLHHSGVRIAFDDFGTGFASLTHLKQFPVDHIKIDQSFVRDLEEDEDDRAIVAAVIGLGRSLDLQVTAEGIETSGQAARLQAMGCTIGQGFYFAKPLAASRIPWLFETWRPERVRPTAGDIGQARAAS